MNRRRSRRTRRRCPRPPVVMRQHKRDPKTCGKKERERECVCGRDTGCLVPRVARGGQRVWPSGLHNPISIRHEPINIKDDTTREKHPNFMLLGSCLLAKAGITAGDAWLKRPSGVILGAPPTSPPSSSPSPPSSCVTGQGAGAPQVGARSLAAPQAGAADTGGPHLAVTVTAVTAARGGRTLLVLGILGMPAWAWVVGGRGRAEADQLTGRRDQQTAPPPGCSSPPTNTHVP
jgi:hypothetical protein